MKQKTSVSYMCSACNDFSVFDVSIFHFSGNRKKEYKCCCGNSTILIIKNGTKSFKVEFMCPVCNEMHSYVIPQNQFWSNDVFTFSCPFYEANLLYVGNREKLEKQVGDYIKNELNYQEGPSFLPDETIFDKVVELSNLVKANPECVNICDCGETYSIAYNEQGLYIICDKCGFSLNVAYDRVELIYSDLVNNI